MAAISFSGTRCLTAEAQAGKWRIATENPQEPSDVIHLDRLITLLNSMILLRYTNQKGGIKGPSRSSSAPCRSAKSPSGQTILPLHEPEHSCPVLRIRRCSSEGEAFSGEPRAKSADSRLMSISPITKPLMPAPPHGRAEAARTELTF